MMKASHVHCQTGKYVFWYSAGEQCYSLTDLIPFIRMTDKCIT